MRTGQKLSKAPNGSNVAIVSNLPSAKQLVVSHESLPVALDVNHMSFSTLKYTMRARSNITNFSNVFKAEYR